MFADARAIRPKAFSCSAFHSPRSHCVIRPSGRTAVAFTMISPAPPAARLARCVRCQSVGHLVPGPRLAAEYMHWGHPHAVGYLQRPDGIGRKKGTHGSTPYCKGTFGQTTPDRIRVASRPPAVQYLFHGGFNSSLQISCHCSAHSLGDYYEIVINKHPNKYWTV